MKLLKSLAISIAFFLSLTAHAQTKEIINITWGFSIGSNQANSLRLICEEANKLQDKYTFLLVGKPGAGGTIAANEVHTKPNNILAGGSSSFVIRPLYEKNEVVHNLDLFTPVVVQATGAPMAVFSKKYKTFQELMLAPKPSIGISGNGSIGHLTAVEFFHLNKNINIVSFKSNIDAGVAAAGEHIDASVGFITDLQALLDNNSINVLGYTGKKEITPNANLLLSKQKLPESTAIASDYAIFASTAMSPERFKELHSILALANRQPAVVNNYSKDLATGVNMNLDQAKIWYANSRSYWKTQVDKLNSK